MAANVGCHVIVPALVVYSDDFTLSLYSMIGIGHLLTLNLDQRM